MVNKFICDKYWTQSFRNSEENIFKLVQFKNLIFQFLTNKLHHLWKPFVANLNKKSKLKYIIYVPTSFSITILVKRKRQISKVYQLFEYTNKKITKKMKCLLRRVRFAESGSRKDLLKKQFQTVTLPPWWYSFYSYFNHSFVSFLCLRFIKLNKSSQKEYLLKSSHAHHEESVFLFIII